MLMTRDLVPGVLRERLESLVVTTWDAEGSFSNGSQELDHIQVLITGARGLPGTLLSRLPRLQLILLTGTGFEYVDRDHCERHGITVCNTPGYTGSAVAEHAFSLFLAHAKNICGLDTAVRNDAETAHLRSVEVEGKTAGIVGLGNVGSRIAKLARGFGMKVVYVSRTDKAAVDTQRVRINELLQCSDVIFLTLPETDETSGIIGIDAFSSMRENCFLVNVSAEGLVDRNALRSTLVTGSIAGAALDIVSPDPIYRTMPRLIITPAHGWYTRECIERRARIWIETLAAYLEENPHNVVIGSR